MEEKTWTQLCHSIQLMYFYSNLSFATNGFQEYSSRLLLTHQNGIEGMYKSRILVMCCLLSWITPTVCQSICGFSQYNPTFSMCCNGVVQPKSGLRPSCCGTQGYDATFYMCCSGTIQPRS